MKNKLPKSIRKYIRKEKSRIRREVFDVEEQKKQIEELIERNCKKSSSPKTAKPKK